MKQGRLSVCLVLVSLLLLLPMFGQAVTTTSYDSIVIDNFDQEGSGQDWVWYAQASGFSVEGFPKVQYVNGVPNSLRFSIPEGTTAKVLGVEASFKRKGDNWVEIFPAKQDSTGKYAPYNIPLKGRVDHLDLWVWGAGYSYNLDMLVRDAYGRVHSLAMGKLNYFGWRNVKVTIPSWLTQRSKFRTGSKTMYFVGFRVRTDPQAPVDICEVYFDQFKYLTDVFADAYDGYDLDTIVFGEGAGK